MTPLYFSPSRPRIAKVPQLTVNRTWMDVCSQTNIEKKKGITWVALFEDWLLAQIDAYPGMDKPTLRTFCSKNYPGSVRKGAAYKAWLIVMRAYFDPESIRLKPPKPPRVRKPPKAPPPREALTADRLRALVSYNPDTGEFSRASSGTRRAGKPIQTKLRNDYRLFRVDSGLFCAHRLAWMYMHGKWPEGVIDHINGVRSDNRIVNLRDVTQLVNMQNQRRARLGSKTGLLGVHPHRNKFQVQITAGEKIRHIGLFATAAEGHEAYLTAKRRFHEGCTI